MADNSAQGGTDIIRDLARQAGTVKTQTFQLDLGGPTTNAEILITAGQQLMAVSVPVVLASNQTALPVKNQDGTGVAITSLGDGSTGTGLGVSGIATNFVVSPLAANSTTTQLAAAATFTGTLESIFNQQSISILLVADQACTLVLNSYIDAAGTRKAGSFSYVIAAGVGFNRAFTANGNYYNVTLTNNGASATTTLNLNVAQGTLPAVTNLGNLPAAVNEIGGTALALGQTLMATSVPVTLASNQTSLPTLDSSDVEYVAVATTVTSVGDTTVYTPAAGKKIRLHWVYAINDPAATTSTRITIKLGAVTKYLVYGVSKKQVDTGPADGALIVNLSAAGNVACSFRLEEV